MRKPRYGSISGRLTLWLSLLISFVIATGSFVAYQVMKGAIYRQIDQELEETISIIQIEIEIEGDAVTADWKGEFPSYGEGGKLFIQTKNLVDGSIFRSDSLGDATLPEVELATGESMVTVIDHEEVRRLRVFSKHLYPVYEDDQDTLLLREDYPHIVSAALDLKDVQQSLDRTKLALGLACIFCCLGTIIVGRFLIRQSLRPLKKLEENITSFDTRDPRGTLPEPPQVPQELRGLVSKYQTLFQRITEVRVHEREFSTNVAHELRTPLAGISATIERALSGERSIEDYRARLLKVQDASQTLEQLVKRLLQFSRVQNGTENVHLETIDLRLFIDVALQRFAGKIERKNLTLVKERLDGAAMVYSDEILLGTIINNLVGNAVDHSPSDSKIFIEEELVERDLVLEMRNRLQPESAIDINRVFESFYTGDTARAVDERHSGIGLALVQQIAHLLKMEVDATINKDQMFVVRLRFVGTSRL